MNIFESLNEIDDRKSLREDFTDGKYCIVAVTNDGKRKFYKDGTFIDDCKNCTVFTDLDEARDVWHEIDKSKFRRVFVPNWSEDMFCESINEAKEVSVANKVIDGLKKKINDNILPRPDSFIRCGDECFEVIWDTDVDSLSEDDINDFIEMECDEGSSVEEIINTFISVNLSLRDNEFEYVDFGIMTDWDYCSEEDFNMCENEDSDDYDWF